MNPQGIDKLVYAIMHQAARDYIEALEYFRRPGRKTRRGALKWDAMIYDCETFFIDDLKYYNLDLDGLEILDALERRTERMGNRCL